MAKFSEPSKEVSTKLAKTISSSGGLYGGPLDYTDVIEARDRSPYDKATEDLIGHQYQQALMSNDDIANQYTANVDKSSQVLGSPESSERRNASLGMLPNPAISQAIQNQAQIRYKNDLNNMRQRELLAAPARRFDRTQAALQSLGTRQDIMQKSQDRKVALALQQKAARGNTITSIFSGVGAIVGGIFGGPGGAAGGAQAGSSFGGLAAGGA